MVVQMHEEFLKKTYSNKKVFVTGHTGFKGTWLISWLKTLNAIVKGYSLAPESDSLYEHVNGDSLCRESINGDIRNSELLRKEILEFQPDFIFHLAAQPLVRTSYEMPAETFDINVMGTANLLGSLQGLSGCTVVIVTTDKVYHNMEWLYPYREDDRLGGYDPYSASKAACEIVVSSYRDSFFNINNFKEHRIAIATARAGNVIGGGDWSKDRIIPDIVRAFHGKHTLLVRNPSSVRPWQHVLEPLSGYLLLGAKLNSSPEMFTGSWNFGPYPHDSVPVGDLVKEAQALWGSGFVDFMGKDSNGPHEAGLLKLDINKAQALLGWVPAYDTNEALKITLEWYKNFLEGSDAINLISEDLKEYTKKLK